MGYLIGFGAVTIGVLVVKIGSKLDPHIGDKNTTLLIFAIAFMFAYSIILGKKALDNYEVCGPYTKVCEQGDR